MEIHTIEVRIQDNTVWLIQKLIASLFDVDRSVITKHLANIYHEGELMKESTCAIFAQVQTEGKEKRRHPNGHLLFYFFSKSNFYTLGFASFTTIARPPKSLPFNDLIAS